MVSYSSTITMMHGPICIRYKKKSFGCLNLNLDKTIMTTLHKDVSVFRSNVKCNPLIFVKKGIELNKIHVFP